MVNVGILRFAEENLSAKLSVKIGLAIKNNDNETLNRIANEIDDEKLRRSYITLLE